MSRSSVCALLLLTLAVLTPARAQNELIGPDKPLSLDQFVALAVQKNFGLQIQSNNLESQKESLQIARSIFDPNISASFSHRFNEAATTSELEASKSDSTNFSLGVTQLLPWTNGQVSLRTAPSRSASNNRFSNLNPAYNAGLDISYTQSLRDFGPRVARQQIDRARIQLSVNQLNYRNQVQTLIANAENAYLNLVNARETLQNRQLSLGAAQRVFDENTTRMTTGVLTSLDVLTSEVAVASASSAVLQAEQSVRNAEEELLNLIAARDLEVRPGPVKFDDYTEGVPNASVSYRTARESYPATLSANEQLRLIQMDLDTARRNLRPNISLSGGLGYPGVPTSQGYWEVISNLPSDHGNNWNINISYSVPWGRRSAKAQYRQAQIALNSQQIRIEQAEQELSMLIRQAVRTVETQLQAVEIASKRTVLASRQYDQQKARFDAGLTTTRQLLQFQDDLENARFAELGAKLALRRAAAALRQIEGTSLQRYGVQLQP